MSNNFTTRSTQRERKYRNRRRPQYRSREKESSFSLSKFLLRVFGIAIILGVCGVLFIWGAYIKGAPDVGLIEKGGYFVESTVYYDGDG